MVAVTENEVTMQNNRNERERERERKKKGGIVDVFPLCHILFAESN